ncbi:RNA polymerase sigma factor [Pseudonocardia sp.]|uniref:RNA polymerase sigma factor n=1 Tax=Pseudonocardia sp. TaxID=60912 RepID=UPI003D13F0B7
MSALVDHRSDPGDPARSRGSWPAGTGPAASTVGAPHDRAHPDEPSEYDGAAGHDGYRAGGHGAGNRGADEYDGTDYDGTDYDHTDYAADYDADDYGTPYSERDARYVPVEADAGAGGRYAEAEQDAENAPVGRQRAQFGRHLEAHYPRLVAQLYAITLDAGQAHDLVQEAYARAWRTWPEIVRRGEPADWVRRVAVSTSMRSWSAMVGRLARRRPPEIETMEPRAAALVGALQRISPAERRAVVLHHMVGMPVTDIAALERRPARKIEARLVRARLAVTEDMGDVFLDILGAEVGDDRD